MKIPLKKVEQVRAIREEMERRRRKSFLLNYEPHPKQQLFHDSKANTRLLEGGNRSGKSTGGIAEDIANALGFRPWDNDSRVDIIIPNKGFIGAPDFENAHQKTTIPKIKEMAPEGSIVKFKKGQHGIENQIHWVSGSITHLMSYDQKVSKYESADWDWIHWDEPPPEAIWKAASRGLIDRGGRQWFTMTPLSEPWIFDQIHCRAGIDPSIENFVMSIHENPHLTMDAVELYLGRLSPEERDTRERGIWHHLSGLIYKEFDRTVHVVDNMTIPDSWPRGVVVDPHGRKPFAIAWFAVSPSEDIYFYDEWPKDHFVDMKSYVNTIEFYADLIKSKEGRDQIFLWYLMDPNFGRSPNPVTGKTLEEEFCDYDLFFDTDILDCLDTGHMAVHKALGYDEEQELSGVNKPKLFITKNCHNTIFGMEHYQWDDFRGRTAEGKAVKEKPKDKFKDFPDLVRYTCVYEPTYGTNLGVVHEGVAGKEPADA